MIKVGEFQIMDERDDRSYRHLYTTDNKENCSNCYGFIAKNKKLPTKKTSPNTISLT